MIYIDGIIYSLQKHGGISVYFNQLIDALGNNELPFLVGLLEEDKRNIHLNIDKRVIDFRKKLIFERIRKCKTPINTKVFHSSYYRLPTSSKIPSITTVHDFIHEKYFNTVSSKVFSQLKKKAIINSEIIICVSEQTKTDLLYYVPQAKSKKIVIIPNGISSFFCKIKTNKSRFPFFLYVGTSAKYKNIDIVLKSLEFLSEIKLVWVGASFTDMDLVKTKYANISNKVIFLNQVGEKKLRELYNNCICLVYISDYEGFGIPFYEATKCRTPVIIYQKNPVFKDYHQDTIVLENLNPKLLSLLIDKSSTLDKISFTKRLFKKINKIEWGNTHNKTINLYKEFI